MPESSLTIDVVSDIVCPWCYLGKRRLQRALEEIAVPVEVRWRAFQLDPTIPPAGIDRHDYLKAKFGDLGQVKEVHDRLTEMGRHEGVPFAFDLITRAPNTLDAHRLVRWAAAAGRQEAVVERLFRLYFAEGGDPSDRETLVEIAEEEGLDADLVGQLFEAGADIEAVKAEILRAQEAGIEGVPTFILAGRYALSGAQPPHVLLDALRHVAAMDGERPVAGPA